MGTARLEGPLGLLAPLLIWGGHFLFVYGLVALACARGFGNGLVLPAVWLASLVAVVVLAGLGRVQWRGLRRGPALDRHFMLQAGLLLSLLSLVAVLWTALPSLFLAPCA